MYVVADLQASQDPQSGERGIPRYAVQYARAVEAHYPGTVNEWLLDPTLPVPPSVDSLLSSGRVRHTPERINDYPDIFHVLSPFEPPQQPFQRLVPPWAQSSRTRLVVTLYDLIPLLYPEVYLTDHRVRGRYMSRVELVRLADHILAISEATARDAVRLLGISSARISVAGTGVDEQFRRPSDRAASLSRAQSAIPTLRPGFVMYTGGIEFRKNMDRLLTAYARLSEDLRASHQLVVVCRTSQEERYQIESRARALGIVDDIILSGYVPDELLVSLYQSAHLFVFPSLYEGFGLPVAEAMACGTPAIVSDNSSLADLLPIPEARFDAESAESIARALYAGLSDEQLRIRLRSAAAADDHSWSLVAERSVDAYQMLYRKRRPRRRPRVALVSPMPPAPSGVADYSFRLLNALSQRFDVDVFCQDGSATPDIPNVRWRHYSVFGLTQAVVGGYDKVIAAMGNSTHHIDVWEIVRQHGGDVIAHDVRQTGMFDEAMKIRPDLVPDSYRTSIAQRRSGEVPPEIRSYRSFGFFEYDRLNGMMVGELVAAADHFYVHSKYAETLAKLNTKPEHQWKISCIPFAFSEARSNGERPINLGEQCIVSFGMVAESKQSQKVAKAFVHLAERRSDLVFALIGEILDERLAESIHNLIKRSPAGKRVKLAGRVGEDEYEKWLERANLAVQLRAYSNGETSAAIADCLRFGVPVIASDVGANRELPANAIVKVAPEICVDDLATTVEQLIDDPDRLAAMSVQGIQLARSSPFDRVVRRLLVDLP